MAVSPVQLGSFIFANDQPLALFGGLNLLEDLDLAPRCDGHYKQVCERLDIPLVFKESYTKPMARRFILSTGSSISIMAWCKSLLAQA